MKKRLPKLIRQSLSDEIYLVDSFYAVFDAAIDKSLVGDKFFKEKNSNHKS